MSATTVQQLSDAIAAAVVRRSARVASKDPVTGEPITMTVTPAGVEDLFPASALVSFNRARPAIRPRRNPDIL